MQPKARRTIRLGDSQRVIGFAAGGAAGSRLAGRLAMPVSGETLLRMITAAEFEPTKVSCVVGIDDWAWRKSQRYGTIIINDLERSRVLALLPDRTAETVALWLGSHPGIEIVARAGAYADGALREALDAIQVADRWRLFARQHAAGKAWIPETEGSDDPTPQSTAEVATKLARKLAQAAAKPASRVLRGNPSLAAVRHVAAPDRAADRRGRENRRALACRGGEPELRGAPDRPEHPGPLTPRMLQNRQRHRLANPLGRCSRGVVPWPSRRSNQPEYPCPAPHLFNWRPVRRPGMPEGSPTHSCPAHQDRPPISRRPRTGPHLSWWSRLVKAGRR